MSGNGIGEMLSAGDTQKRIAELYTRYGGLIYGRCVQLLRDDDRARDATHDVFLKIVRDNQRLNARRENPLPWVFSVTTCHCLDLLRALGRKQEKESGAAARSRDPLMSYNTVAERQLVARVLSRFDSKTQAVAIGVLVEGMEQEELARTLGLSRRTVSRKLDRFLTDARKYILRGAA